MGAQVLNRLLEGVATVAEVGREVYVVHGELEVAFVCSRGVFN